MYRKESKRVNRFRPLATDNLPYQMRTETDCDMVRAIEEHQTVCVTIADIWHA